MVRHEHPEWVASLEAGGRLDELTITQLPRIVQAVYFTFGFAMVALGAVLLVGRLGILVD